MKEQVLPIILVHFNNFDDTSACVNSIFNSVGIQPFVIIVDNASTKGNDVRQLEREGVIILKNKVNIGFGRANNQGINWALEHLHFEHLLLLNNDTLLEPDAIKILVSTMNKDQEIGICTSRIMFEKQRNIVWYGGGTMSMTKGWPKVIEAGKQASKEGALKARTVTFISGCVMLFSHASLKVLSGFDEAFFMYCEDMELSIRTTKQGFKMYYCPDSIVYHKVQGSFDRTEDHGVGIHYKNPNLAFNFLHKKTNQWITMRKHLKGLKFMFFACRYWLEFFIKVIRLRLKGRKDIVPIARTVIRNIFAYNG